MNSAIIDALWTVFNESHVIVSASIQHSFSFRYFCCVYDETSSFDELTSDERRELVGIDIAIRGGKPFSNYAVCKNWAWPLSMNEFKTHRRLEFTSFRGRKSANFTILFHTESVIVTKAMLGSASRCARFQKIYSHKFTVTFWLLVFECANIPCMHSIQSICVKSIKMSAHVEHFRCITETNPYQSSNQIKPVHWRFKRKLRLKKMNCNTIQMERFWRLLSAHCSAFWDKSDFQRFRQPKIDWVPFIMRIFKCEKWGLPLFKEPLIHFCDSIQ